MEQGGYEASDVHTGVVLARAATAAEALDRACRLIAAQVRTGGEGADHMRYELAATALDGPRRTWAATRVYYPGKHRGQGASPW